MTGFHQIIFLLLVEVTYCLCLLTTFTRTSEAESVEFLKLCVLSVLSCAYSTVG